MTGGAKHSQEHGRRSHGSKRAGRRSAHKKPQAQPAATEVEPWKQTALSLLIAYLSFHLAALALLTLYPLAFSIPAEGFMVRVYLDLLTMEIQKVALWIIGPLSGLISVATLWRADMDRKRRRLLHLCVAGIVFAALFYVVLYWLKLGINVWQYPGPPNRAQFRDLARAFSFGNFIVFASALFGALGAQMPNWFGGGRS